jgi:hypothetical protein
MNHSKCPSFDTTYRYPRGCSLTRGHNGTHFDIYGREWPNLSESIRNDDDTKDRYPEFFELVFGDDTKED